MNALVRTDYAAWSLSEQVVSDFTGKGAYVFEERLSGRACAELLAEVREDRRFDQTLFLSEDEFREGAAAGSPRSLLSGLEGKLDFVERAPQVVEALWSLLGPDYQVLDRQVVCLLPETSLPAWVQRRIFATGEADLTAFVRPDLRDIAYRVGADLRQEAELGERPGEVVTLEVYLHAVAEADAPLCLLLGSHRMGALGDAPASLKRTGPGAWRYRDGAHAEMFLAERSVVGDAGAAVLRHGWTLCGDARGGQQERITLSYRFGRGSVRAAGIDSVNASLGG